MDDATALEAWIGGDVRAGQVLVRRHYDRILLFFYSKVSSEVARDLTQSTFETLCAKGSGFRGRSSLTTYLFGIARWKLVHHFRNEQTHRRRFDPLRDSAADPVVDVTISSLFEGRRRQTLVVRGLRTLPLDDQVLLELKDYEGLTGRQIAEIFEMNRPAVAARISRARKRLAKAVHQLSLSTGSVEDTDTDIDACMGQIRQTFQTVMGGAVPVRS